LTAVWVPDVEQQALRDLVRTRHAAKRDQLRHRNRLGKFLLQLGVRRPEKILAWGTKHMVWLDGQRMQHASHQEVLVDYLNEVKRAKERIERLEKAIDAAIERAPEHLQKLIAALQTLRGVAKVGAATLVTEVGRFSRFESARQLMAYVGVVPREHSSGGSTRRGSITKTGNARMRHVLGEAAWTYRFKPSVQGALKKRQEGQSEELKAIAWKAQHRLNTRYKKFASQGKHHGRVVTAISRELIVSGRTHPRGESSFDLCGRAFGLQTRATSKRQLPTDHDHEAPTLEYQSDQSSRCASTADFSGSSLPNGAFCNEVVPVNKFRLDGVASYQITVRDLRSRT
jgi:hypothetical protein